MATQISRAKRLIKLLERVIKKDHLYDEEELKLIREQLKLPEMNWQEYKNKHQKDLVNGSKTYKCIS